MSIDEFRKHKYLSPQWRRELRTNGILQAVLEVLEEAHPTRYPVHTDIQDDISPTKAALQLGETRGYSKCLNTIRKLAEPLPERQSTPPTTYEKPAQETEQAA